MGIDCVAMCVNDVVLLRRQALFFLDYVAVGKTSLKGGQHCLRRGGRLRPVGLRPHRRRDCGDAGFYPEDEYDLAGFTVGVVDKDKILDPAKVEAGDVIIGLASSGVHSSSFSLVRKVFDVENADLGEYYDELGSTLGNAS